MGEGGRQAQLSSERMPEKKLQNKEEKYYRPVTKQLHFERKKCQALWEF